MEIKRPTELDKIITCVYGFDIKEAQYAKMTLTCNPLLSCSKRYITTKKELDRCLKYCPYGEYTLINHIMIDEYTAEKIGIDVTSRYGNFSYKFIIEKTKKGEIYFPLKLTDDLLEHVDELYSDGYLYLINFDKVKFNTPCLHKLLKVLSKDKKTEYDTILHELMKNPTVDISYLMTELNISTDDLIMQYIKSALKNKTFPLALYVKDIIKYIDEITGKVWIYAEILESPALTDEIMETIIGHIQHFSGYYKIYIQNHKTLYTTLSKDMLLKYFTNLDPILMYVYKNYEVDNPTWYKYKEFRDDFIKTIKDKENFYKINALYRFRIFVVKNIKLTDEVIHDLCKIPESYNYLYKNPSLTPELIRNNYKLKSMKKWFLTKHIDMKTIINILKSIPFARFNYNIYLRTDMPINDLLAICKYKIDNRICKNIYVTSDVLTTYRIKPNLYYLKHNMMSLDPRYIKQPSYTIEL